MAETLALHGGTPVRATPLPYARHAVDDEDLQAVAAALRSDWLTTGPCVEAFERAVASFVAAKHAVAVNSGTAALHCAVFAAGAGTGHEVITSPLTFVASANAVLYQGGVPIFADIRSDTLMLDPAEVAPRITSRTRAILPVDFAGQGGMVTTDDDALASRLRRFRNHGLDTDFRQRAARGATYSEMVDLGYNYRLSDVQCALGLSQFGRLEQFLKRRSSIAERYAGALASVPEVAMPAVSPHVRHAWHIFPVLLRLEQLRADRDTILAGLRAENIGAAVHYVPAYWHPYYQALGYRRGLCPRAEEAYERILTLPLFPAMADRDIDDGLKRLVTNAAEPPESSSNRSLSNLVDARRARVQILNGLGRMKRYQERDLEILTAIGEGRPLTQRLLAQRLGVALGLTNLYLKRLASKGLIKISEFPYKPAARKRLRYVLTPKGLLEKSRLTYEYMSYSLGIYRRTRETLREALGDLHGRGLKRIAFYRPGEAAELAYVTLKEFGLEPLAVFDRNEGGFFLGLPVRPIAQAVDAELDAIVIATFERPEPDLAELTCLGIPREKLLTLRRPLPAGGEASRK